MALRGTRPRVELLEDRTLLSVASRVTDVHLTFSGISPPALTNVNGTLFFAADDGVNGVELWKSDGTAAGTRMVKNINPSGDSFPQALTKGNGVVYFAADDGTHGLELWRSDGSDLGTFLVRDINATVPGASSSLVNLTNVGGTLFFAADDGVSGTELWKSDGTSGGTQMLNLNTTSPTAASNPTNLTDVNGTLFFAADDGASGVELWKSNGGAVGVGTVLVADINTTGPGAASSPSRLTNFNGTLFFQASDGANGAELWKSTGTGASLVANINPGGSSFPDRLTAVNNTLFFAADNGTSGAELWKSDGTTLGTVPVRDINTSTPAAPSNPLHLTNVNGILFFSADDGVDGRQLWKSDGTFAGTVLLKVIATAPGGDPMLLTNVNGTLFYTAGDGASGVELWKSSGTTAGTVMAADINSSAGSFPSSLRDVNGTLFFVADDGVNGFQLWKVSHFSDDFERTDNTNLGAGWTETLGDFAIYSGELIAVDPAVSRALVAGPGLANVRVQAEVAVLTGGISSIDLLARYVNAANTYLGTLTNNNGSYAVALSKIVAGVSTMLASATVTASGGGADVLRLEVAGTSLRLFFNDALVLKTRDATFANAGQAGIRGTQFTTVDQFFFSPIDPELPFGDNFDRANFTFLGSQWIENAGDLAIQNRKLKAVGSPIANLALYPWAVVRDVVVQAQVAVLGFGSSEAGLVARYSGPADKNMYFGALSVNAGVYTGRIYEQNNGSWTLLVSGPASTGAGLLRFEVVDRSLKLFLNGTLLCKTESTTFSGPGQVGIRGGALTTFDNFSAQPIFPTLFGDAFNRANSPNLGADWFTPLGGVGVDANRAKFTNLVPTNLALRHLVVLADVKVEANLFLVAANNEEVGLIARCVDNNNMYYAALRTALPGVVFQTIYRVSGGVKTMLANALYTGGLSAKMRFEVIGTSLKLFLNDSLTASLSASDATLTIGLTGMRGTQNCTVDQFVMTR